MSAELVDLYQALQQDFHPLKLCKRIAPHLEALKSNDSLKQYVAPLQKVALTRLLKQVCAL